jgi:hypothetical protein
MMNPGPSSPCCTKARPRIERGEDVEAQGVQVLRVDWPVYPRRVERLARGQ